MRINSLKISNILSFKYHEDISDAECITLDNGLNIIIGENGSGKSTSLEVINFLFKRIFAKQHIVNQDLYSRKTQISAIDRKQILTPANNNTYSGFRLEPNWNTIGKPQTIRVEIALDEIDETNIQNLKNNAEKLNGFITPYTTRNKIEDYKSSESYTLDITLQRSDQTFTVKFHECVKDFGYEYLSDYTFFKEAISLFNLENPSAAIDILYESFTLISSYRNYHAFARTISLQGQTPYQQIQQIRQQDFSKSLNTSDQAEPTIFGLVRLRIAEKHFELISQSYDNKQCENLANTLPFIVEINERLKIVNLECKIRLTELRTWQYSFEFIDLKRRKYITDINSLSAGQKAIIHLVFEAYGRGDLKGGLVIIDEPEIHLHYQFQNEYLNVIRSLNETQRCQYILVTHSEALISSSTISQVRRFSLSDDGYTQIKSPRLSNDQKSLIRILDNTRSTYAFFAKKVVLVEGDTDRYFFRAALQHIHPLLGPEVAILHIGGKKNNREWRNLFEAFGLSVYFVADFDFVADRFYHSQKSRSLKTAWEIRALKIQFPAWEINIDEEYANKNYILKDGDLEHYLGISKGLDDTIAFCNTRLADYLTDETNSHSREIREIVSQIAS